MDGQSTLSQKFEESAKLIAKATFFCIGAGAGMSADSGLATYNDVSQVFEYFKKNNLEYRDLARPEVLAKTPQLFFGWSGVCVEKYRNAKPHAGYYTLKKWKDHYFTNTPHTSKLRQEMINSAIRTPKNPNVLTDTCFVYTTNVDGFFTSAGFSPSEICQTHGNYLMWQCSGIPKEKHAFKLFDKPCTNQVWKIPDDFEFQIDVANMLAPVGAPKRQSTKPGWTTNNPTCPNCGELQRPNVYNFGDTCFIENEEEETNRSNWFNAVERIIKGDANASIVMLELGVGQRLPKIRVIFERLLKALPPGRATIIRVNPQISKGDRGEGIIDLACGADDALAGIDKFLFKTTTN